MGLIDLCHGRLSAMDAGFLWMETPSEPLHVGVVLIAEGPPPTFDAFCSELLSLVSGAPLLRIRIQQAPARIARPFWVDDDAVDLGRHVGQATVDPAAGPEALNVLVGDLMKGALPPEQPLWWACLIDGLPAGRWAVFLKAHHSLIDGTTGLDLLEALVLGGSRSRAAFRPRIGLVRWVMLGSAWLALLPLRVVRTSARAAVHPRAARGRLQRIQRGFRAVARPDLVPNILNGPLTGRRSWAWVTWDLDAVRKVAESSACTVNDVVLACSTGALRTVLAASGEDPGRVPVRCLIPVAPRRVPARPVGNRVSAMFAFLPVDEPDVHRRLVLVSERTGAGKSSGTAGDTLALLAAADHVPAPLMAVVAGRYVRIGQRRVNACITNVRGPVDSGTLCGRPVVGILPCVPLALNLRCAISALSSGGGLTLGVVADSSLGISATALAAGLDGEFAALAGTSGQGDPSHGRAAPGSPARSPTSR